MPRFMVALWTRVSIGSRQHGQKMHRKGIRGVLERHPRGEQMGMFGKDDFLLVECGGKSQILVVLGRSFQLNFVGSIAVQYGKVIIESRER